MPGFPTSSGNNLDDCSLAETTPPDGSLHQQWLGSEAAETPVLLKPLPNTFRQNNPQGRIGDLCS
jgi:hypothetical protein